MQSNITEWKEIARESVFQKYSRIEKVTFELPNGKKSDYYIRLEGPTVCVLALTNESKIIVVKQFRPGPKKIVKELPGGYVDHNEKPELAAERELLEETGYKGKLSFVTTCLDDAYSTMSRYCFVATDCEKVREPKLDEKEFVELELMSINDFRELLRKGQMTDVEVGYLALDFLGLL